MNKSDFINKTINWMCKQTYQEYPGGPIERIITDDMIKEYKKVIEDYESKN